MPSRVQDCTLLVPSLHSSPVPSAPTKPPHHVKLEDVDYHVVEITESSISPFTCPVAIGSLRRVVYKDGAEFVFRVVELSDIHHSISYELIETDSTVNVSGVMHTIQVSEITETAESFISWTTDFSGDCDQHVYTDAKFKKLEAFKDIRSVFELSK